MKTLSRLTVLTLFLIFALVALKARAEVRGFSFGRMSHGQQGGESSLFSRGHTRVAEGGNLGGSRAGGQGGGQGDGQVGRLPHGLGGQGHGNEGHGPGVSGGDEGNGHRTQNGGGVTHVGMPHEGVPREGMPHEGMPHESISHGHDGVSHGGFSNGHDGFSHGHDGISHGNGPIFPHYPEAPRKQIKDGGALRVPSHPDSLGNHVTEDHLHRVDFARDRGNELMRNNTRFTGVVSQGRARFSNVYRPEFEHRTEVFHNYINRYNSVIVEHPLYINTWRNHYFYGGFYWGFHPILEIDTYFYNPMVYWFYVGTFDPYYYRTWYDSEYDAYPELHKPFEYHGLYYPTENLRQLLFGVSGMPVEKQARFRNAIEIFTRRIAQKMANGLDTHVKLGSGDIVVTHYEIVGYDDAVVTEGFVNFGGKAYNFKGLVDISEPVLSDVFIPATWDMNPTPAQLSTLDALNEKIASIKGEPLTASPEPTSVEAPSAGEVSAEPENR